MYSDKVAFKIFVSFVRIRERLFPNFNPKSKFSFLKNQTLLTMNIQSGHGIICINQKMTSFTQMGEDLLFLMMQGLGYKKLKLRP